MGETRSQSPLPTCGRGGGRHGADRPSLPMSWSCVRLPVPMPPAGILTFSLLLGSTYISSTHEAKGSTEEEEKGKEEGSTCGRRRKRRKRRQAGKKGKEVEIRKRARPPLLKFVRKGKRYVRTSEKKGEWSSVTRRFFFISPIRGVKIAKKSPAF